MPACGFVSFMCLCPCRTSSSCTTAISDSSYEELEAGGALNELESALANDSPSRPPQPPTYQEATPSGSFASIEGATPLARTASSVTSDDGTAAAAAAAAVAAAADNVSDTNNSRFSLHRRSRDSGGSSLNFPDLASRVSETETETEPESEMDASPPHTDGGGIGGSGGLGPSPARSGWSWRRPPLAPGRSPLAEEEEEEEPRAEPPLPEEPPPQLEESIYSIYGWEEQRGRGIRSADMAAVAAAAAGTWAGAWAAEEDEWVGRLAAADRSQSKSSLRGLEATHSSRSLLLHSRVSSRSLPPGQHSRGSSRQRMGTGAEDSLLGDSLAGGGGAAGPPPELVSAEDKEVGSLKTIAFAGFR